MSGRPGAVAIADLRLLADDIETGRAIVTSSLTTSCVNPGGLTAVQVHVRRVAIAPAVMLCSGSLQRVVERYGWDGGKCPRQGYDSLRDGPPPGAIIRIGHATKCPGHGDWWNINPKGMGDMAWTMRTEPA